MMRALLLCLALIAPSLIADQARADVAEVIAHRITPGFAAFQTEAEALARAAETDCAAVGLRAPWGRVYDAWMGVQHFRFGPSEEKGRSLAALYWPDPKQIGARQLKEMQAKADPALITPEGMAQVSVAAKGLGGLERLLYGPAYTPESYDCALVRAMSADLATQAQDLVTAWQGYAPLLLRPSADGPYKTPEEVRQVLFTQLVTGLEYNALSRLGRPLGTFEKPHPERAEAWLSERAQPNLVASLTALSGLSTDLLPLDKKAPLTEAAISRAITLAGALPDPSLALVGEPMGRLKVEIVQQAVQAAHDAAEAEIGPSLGVAAGFNSADGD